MRHPEHAIYIVLFSTLLFVALSPGILFSFPTRGTSIKRVLVHSVLFATLLYLVYIVSCSSGGGGVDREGFTANMSKIISNASGGSFDTSLNLNGTMLPISVKTNDDGSMSVTSDENIIIDILKNPSNYFVASNPSIALSSLSDVSGTNSQYLPAKTSFF